jgi:hypothetical protein
VQWWWELPSVLLPEDPQLPSGFLFSLQALVGGASANIPYCPCASPTLYLESGLSVWA